MFIPGKFLMFIASVFLSCIILLYSLKTSEAQERVSIERVSTPKWLYDLEAAEFFYYAGNYPHAFLLSKQILKQNINLTDVDRVLLLKELAGLRLRYYDSAPHGLHAENSASGIFLLLNTLYRQGDYEAILSLSKEAADAASLYFRGLAFYTLDRFDEAITPLSNISEKEAVFPDATMLLSQIMAAKGDFASAEKYLNKTVDAAEGDTLNRVYLLMGYLYFEKKDFLKARENFFKIDAKSGFYKYARLGAAWSYVNTGMYDKALSLSGYAGGYARHYDSMELEMGLISAYSNYRLGKLKEAKEGFLETLQDLKTAEEELRLLADEAASKEKYAMVIVNAGERNAGKSANAAYIELFKKSPEVILAAAYYNGFMAVKSSYEKEDADINSLAMSLERSIKAKEGVMADAVSRVEKIKKLLTVLNRELENQENKESSKDDELGSSERAIIKRWEKLLNRFLTRQEKYIVHLVAISGESGLWCLNNTTYCPILYMMTIDPSKNRAEDSEQGILDRIVKDMQRSKGGEPIRYEKEMDLLKNAVPKKIDEERGMILKLKKLKAIIEENRKSAGQGAEKSLKLMERHIGSRAAMMRYEVIALEQKAVAGMDEVDKAMEAQKK